MYSFAVAPHAGAWIEAIRFAAKTGRFMVAPHVGAWIEAAEKACNQDRGIIIPLIFMLKAEQNQLTVDLE